MRVVSADSRGERQVQAFTRVQRLHDVIRRGSGKRNWSLNSRSEREKFCDSGLEDSVGCKGGNVHEEVFILKRNIS